MTIFGKLQPDGTITDRREIRQADLQACPHVILVAAHYRHDFRGVKLRRPVGYG
jgi:hypothetical protein